MLTWCTSLVVRYVDVSSWFMLDWNRHKAVTLATLISLIGQRERWAKGKQTYPPLMKQLVYAFLNDEQGQDLIEYTLLMAFVALASAALFLGAGGSIKGIWTTSNSQLEAANSQS